MSEGNAWIWSTGDRVRLRWRLPARHGPYPLVLYLASEGGSGDPDAEAARQAWSDFAAVASIDLPLFAERANAKLIGLALSSHALGEPLRDYVRAQLGRDLGAARAHLAEAAALEGRAGLVAAGRAGRVVAGMEPGDFDPVIASPDPADEGWLREAASRLRASLAS